MSPMVAKPIRAGSIGENSSEVCAQEGVPAELIDEFAANLNSSKLEIATGQARVLTQRYPNDPTAWKALGVALSYMGRYKDAIAPMHKAVALNPDDPESHSNLSHMLRESGFYEWAEESCREALKLAPNYPEAQHNLGNALQDLCRYEQAEIAYRRAIDLAPNFSESHQNLGIMLSNIGRFEEAEQSFSEGLRVDPVDFSMWDCRLFAANYNHCLSSVEVFRKYEAYGRAVALATKRVFEHDNRGYVSGRRIRIGYSSPDFRDHACRFFMEPILRNHDREHFEVFAYSNTLKPDQHTERMKGFFDHWVDVGRMTDEEMAQRVYDDQIDILVDMAGHTRGNRLPVFAMRPAPIQASYWTGFAYTTGLKEIDYFICDENLVPEGSEVYFSEEPLRIPAPGYAYAPPREITPEVSDLPALRNGYVTFGSLTRTARLNDPLLRIWGDILERVPNSRLRLDQSLFTQEESRELFWERLEGLGVPRERVDLVCSKPHWNAYHDIDITLDCWPHNAGTTTLESLWMGVPVLSKIDRASVGRVGAAVLKPLGLDDWLVESEEAFVERAVAVAADLSSLAELRRELRFRLEGNELSDGCALVHKVENEYRRVLLMRMSSAAMGDDSSSLCEQMQPCVAHGKTSAQEEFSRPNMDRKMAETEIRKRQSSVASPARHPTQQQVDDLLRSYQSGSLSEAERMARLLIEGFSHHPFAWKVMGAILKQTGRSNDSLLYMQKSVELSPCDAEAHNNLGVTLQDLGIFDEALASLRQAVTLKPDYADAYCNLGVTLEELGQLDEAEASFRKSFALDADYAEAHSNLGNVLRELGRFDEAEARSRQAIALKPDYAEAHSNLGATLAALGRFDEAEASFRQAITQKPDFAEAHYNLANTLTEMGRLEEAEGSHRSAITLNSDYAEAHNNLGNIAKELGRVDEAAASYRQAITQKPDFAEARDNLLFALNYDHRLSAADLYGEYAAYGEAITKLTKRVFEHDNRGYVSGRRIRIGYSSPDFRDHACRFFMEPILRNHDREHFEVFAYSNTLKPDQHTERMKGFFDHWVDVGRMTDEEMAQRVYDDQIDILVDMAGHTRGNRLPVFAMRPAPIQASYWTGFAYTTGLKEIDYFICDENLVPEGSEVYFSEEPLRIPAPGYAYAPPREITPEVSDLPALRNGYVTFGSLTRTVRLNDPLLRIWGDILERVPNSRLRLDQSLFAQKESRELFWERLEGLGVPRERVDLVCSKPHWNAYHDIDITLDCWPHNAGTTTLESLWMGVPVLSKIDRASVGRVGAAVLKPLGLDDWLVESEEAFVERAAAFAYDLDSLSKLRAELRGRFEQGPHMDASAMTKHLENAYRQMV